MPERATSRKPMKILVTGVAGFIGMHCARRLLQRGDAVTGIDNLNDYYEVCLKKDRLNRLARRYCDTGRFATHRMSIENREALRRVFDEERPRRVIHLAAQVGVRNSVENPHDYIDTNIKGFMNVLECCADHRVEHLVYASSSSVYGVNESLPYSEDNRADHPKSIYGATKKANELMAHAFSDLHALPTTGLRFFTVYGPWGRPDMALFKFARAIMEGRAIDVYDGENMVRDFTYIDDIVEGVIRVMDKSPAAGDAPESSGATRRDALPRIQHRQGAAHRAHGLYRRARARAWREGEDKPYAATAWRRAGHRGRHIASREMGGISPGYRG